MCEPYALFLCHNGSRHGGCQVVDNHYGVCLTVLKVVLEERHHLPGNLVEVLAYYSEAYVGASELQVVEERGLQSGIVLAAGVYKAARDVQSLFACPVDGAHQWSYLYEVRPRSANNAYFHSCLII